MTHFNKLPQELKTMIFDNCSKSDLRQCVLTCSNWYRLLPLSFVVYSADIEDILSKDKSLCNSVKHINLPKETAGEHKKLLDILKFLKKRCPNVTTIQSDVYFKPEHWQELSKANWQLEEINVEGDRHYPTNTDSETEQSMKTISLNTTARHDLFAKLLASILENQALKTVTEEVKPLTLTNSSTLSLSTRLSVELNEFLAKYNKSQVTTVSKPSTVSLSTRLSIELNKFLAKYNKSQVTTVSKSSTVSLSTRLSIELNKFLAKYNKSQVTTVSKPNTLSLSTRLSIELNKFLAKYNKSQVTTVSKPSTVSLSTRLSIELNKFLAKYNKSQVTTVSKPSTVSLSTRLSIELNKFLVKYNKSQTTTVSKSLSERLSVELNKFLVKYNKSQTTTVSKLLSERLSVELNKFLIKYNKSRTIAVSKSNTLSLLERLNNELSKFLVKYNKSKITNIQLHSPIESIQVFANELKSNYNPPSNGVVTRTHMKKLEEKRCFIISFGSLRELPSLKKLGTSGFMFPPFGSSKIEKKPVQTLVAKSFYIGYEYLFRRFPELKALLLSFGVACIVRISSTRRNQITLSWIMVKSLNEKELKVNYGQIALRGSIHPSAKYIEAYVLESCTTHFEDIPRLFECTPRLDASRLLELDSNERSYRKLAPSDLETPIITNMPAVPLRPFSSSFAREHNQSDKKPATVAQDSRSLTNNDKQESATAYIKEYKDTLKRTAHSFIQKLQLPVFVLKSYSGIFQQVYFITGYKLPNLFGAILKGPCK